MRRIYNDLHDRVVSHVRRAHRACRVAMCGRGQSISLNAVPSLILKVALGITHADVGAGSWQEVHSHHGHEPNCGQCECDILDQISRRRGPIISQPLSSSPQVELSGGD